MTEQLFAATFVRGNRYIVAGVVPGGGDLCVDRGQTVVISEELRDHLEEDAVDIVAGEPDHDTGERETVSKPKFLFEEYDGEAGVGTIIGTSRITQEPTRAHRRTKREAA